MNYQILVTTQSWMSERPMGSDVSAAISLHTVVAAFESRAAADGAAEIINNQKHTDTRFRQVALRLY